MEKVVFPDRKEFKSHNRNYRDEMSDRAQNSFDKILNAYSAVLLAVRAGQGVEEAVSNLKKVYQEERTMSKWSQKLM